MLADVVRFTAMADGTREEYEMLAAHSRANSAPVADNVLALLHDIGGLHAPGNHSTFAAAVLRPYVSEENHWLVLHHGVFQGYYYFHHHDMDRNARDRFRAHPAFQKTVDFCENWDQCSFDGSYDTMPLDAFEPMVHRRFERVTNMAY